MFAAYKATLTVARVPVDPVGVLAKDGEGVLRLVVLHDPVVRDVADEDIPLVRKVDWAFSPSHAGRELFERAGVDAVLREAWVEDFDRRVGVTLVRRERKRLGEGGLCYCRGG